MTKLTMNVVTGEMKVVPDKKTTAKKAAPTVKPAAKTKAKAKTVAQKELANMTTAPESLLQLVPLDLIDVQPQVRTEFDEESIAELARDIAANGVLQPVLLNQKQDRFVMIAGERRLRAARLANLTHLPAMVGQIEDKAAKRLQLAENIQREELSMQDEVKAIRALFDEMGSLQAVADICHKSKPWVSKRVAVSEPDFNYTIHMLLETGTCEDLETLHAANQLRKIDNNQANILCDLIYKGEAGRETARKMLKEAKEAQAAPKQDAKPTKNATPAGPVQPRKVKFMSWEYKRDINRMLEEGKIDDLLKVIEEMTKDQWTTFEEHHKDYFTTGQDLGPKHGRMAAHLSLRGQDLTNLECACAIWGIEEGKFDLTTIIHSTNGYKEAVEEMDRIELDRISEEATSSDHA